MSLRAAAIEVVDRVFPPPWRGALQRRHFLHTHQWCNLHWGVFDSFASANEFARRHGHTAHYKLDHRQWLTEHLELMPHDYPVLFWLERLLCSPAGRQFSRMADLGGSVGPTYLAFKPYLSLPPALVWQVCELPEVVEFGRQVARECGEEAHLQFTCETRALSGADVLLAAGAIQFIDARLDDMLHSLPQAPPHIFINRVPLTQGEGFVTLQNTGVALCPYHIRNEQGFIDAMGAIGYAVVDRWKCMQNSTHIPLHPERTLDYFHGFYFRRDGAG